MTIEEHVCSYELALKLKELGVKQESIVDWLKIPDIVHMKLNEDGTVFIDENGTSFVDRIEYRIAIGNRFAMDIPKEDACCAFLSSELSELLPENIHIFKLNVKDIIPTWFCAAGECNGKATNWEETQDINQTNAIAKMLIYLIENKLMELPK
jgi:hypothetical protein